MNGRSLKHLEQIFLMNHFYGFAFIDFHYILPGQDIDKKIPWIFRLCVQIVWILYAVFYLPMCYSLSNTLSPNAGYACIRLDTGIVSIQKIYTEWPC
jgi:hypothetical protein